MSWAVSPEMSLAQARERRDEARQQLKAGKDPGLEQKRIRLVRSTPSALTFETFARQWHAHEKARWVPVHADDVITSLERDIFPDLGGYDVSDIDELMISAVLGEVEKRGAIGYLRWRNHHANPNPDGLHPSPCRHPPCRWSPQQVGN